MILSASGALGDFEVEKGGPGASLELGGVFYPLAGQRAINPYFGITIGYGGFEWMYADVTPEHPPRSIDMLYVAPQLGTDLNGGDRDGGLSLGVRLLLARHGLDTFQDFEDLYGRGNYLEIFLAFAVRSEI